MTPPNQSPASRPAKIVHLTSVHPWNDVRIFFKMARSLAAAGFDTHVVALDRQADRPRTFVEDGVVVHIVAGKDIRGRLARATSGARRVRSRALSLEPCILHAHDPELLPHLAFGGLGGAKLVYDAHEDLGGQIESKPWIPRVARPLFRRIASLVELGARRADAIVTATPFIARSFGVKATAIQNFPRMDEFADLIQERTGGNTKSGIYFGGITRARGMVELIDAIGRVSELETFHLAGAFESEALKAQVSTLPGWSKVKYHGLLSRDELRNVVADASFGVLTFLPQRNHVNAQPNKLFEYLAAGLPIVASDFPLWRQVLQPHRVAAFVDPQSPLSIAEGMRRMLTTTPEDMSRMRSNARSVVEKHANWDAEFPKLVAAYQNLLKN